VHNGLYILDQFGMSEAGVEQLFAMPVNGYSIASSIMSELAIPALYAWGNHDGVTRCGESERSELACCFCMILP
jgi:hypothetical protein